MAIKIYYLDDEYHLCEIFKKLLAGENIEVTTFMESAEAIALCAVEPPDLMFIDYRLSDTTGDRVAQALHENIIKILVTGELAIPTSDLFKDIITKPYRLTTIKETIAKQLGVDMLNANVNQDYLLQGSLR